MDLIGKIYPPNSKGHNFIIVDMDYFTKWVEVMPKGNANHAVVIRFVENQIIHRFEIPETINADQGNIFTEERVGAFA